MLRCVLSLVKQTQCRRRISHVKKGAVISGEDQRFRGGPNRIDSRILTERELSENVARVHLGSYEVRKTGVSRFDLRDPYHLAVALTWPQFLAGLLAIYLSVNLVFATLPPRITNARSGSFADAFFFSIETLATVGYGEMYPATPYARVIAGIEIVCGLGFTAILTGLTFVRFSRPRAKLVFAPNPVVAMPSPDTSRHS